MLNEARLSNGYMKEGISIAVNILNRGKLRKNNNKTPYELWFGRAPSVKYFKVFGSKYYIKRIDGYLRKFDARFDESIFLGYSSTKKAYRCYNFRLHKIVESVDVNVDDLKTKKFKHQENILDSESEDDHDLFGTQTYVEEKEDIQEYEIDPKKKRMILKKKKKNLLEEEHKHLPG